ncbi:MAG: glycoside hydrolase family 73 protein [Lentilactobacillus diolivorans]
MKVRKFEDTLVKYRKRRKLRAKKSNLVVMIVLIGLALMITIGFRVLSQSVSDATKVENATDQLAVEHRKFIRTLAPQAQRLQGEYNILPSITLAQAILESDWGDSQLASKYYNLFGVKARSGSNNSVYLDTQEFVNGRYITVKARFQVYNSWDDSLTDHARLLAQGTQWNPQQYHDVLAAQNYLKAADALQKDGYATDPAYTEKLVSIIRNYKLYQYDD